MPRTWVQLLSKLAVAATWMAVEAATEEESVAVAAMKQPGKSVETMTAMWNNFSKRTFFCQALVRKTFGVPVFAFRQILFCYDDN